MYVNTFLFQNNSNLLVIVLNRNMLKVDTFYITFIKEEKGEVQTNLNLIDI